MKVARSVAEVLSQHTTLALEQARSLLEMAVRVLVVVSKKP